MIFTNPFYIGVETSGSKKPFTCAVFGDTGRLIKLAQYDLDELITEIASKPETVVAINSPAGPNIGLVRQEEIRKHLQPLHFSGRNQDMRLAEYKLKEHNINVLMTPSKKELCSNWVQAGFEVYRRLADLGFAKYPHPTSSLLMAETHSHATFCVLAASQPLPKLSIEGRIQRQLILFEEGLIINDPMEFFEEVTRHKLLRGILPSELIYTPEELDAMAAALVAFRVGENSAKIIAIGDKTEGQVILPIDAILEKY